MLALWALAPAAFAGEIYRCVDKSGKKSYSSTPCPGTKPMPGAPKPMAPNLAGVSSAQANEIFDCGEMIFFIEERTRRNQLRAGELSGNSLFDHHCLKYGFRPLTSPNQAYNQQHSRSLQEELRRNNHDAQTCTRTYDGDYRSPPLFGC